MGQRRAREARQDAREDPYHIWVIVLTAVVFQSRREAIARAAGGDEDSDHEDDEKARLSTLQQTGGSGHVRVRLPRRRRRSRRLVSPPYVGSTFHLMVHRAPLEEAARVVRRALLPSAADWCL